MESKKLIFVGSCYDDLVDFPSPARREAGHQLNQVQHGLQPDDWKPMSTIGSGVQEIRIYDEAGQFRVIYVARFEDAVYALHAFKKKTQKTSPKDLEIATKRYKAIAKGGK